MMRCELSYIPKHLHWDAKPLITEFYEGEELYWRYSPKSTPPAYGMIRLYELSVNRQGNPESPISDKDDLLWNSEPNERLPFQRYEDKIPIILIKVSNVNNIVNNNVNYHCYLQTISDSKGAEVEITLVHDPLNCNYAHTLLRLIRNNEVVFEGNYTSLLKNPESNDLREKVRNYILQNVKKQNLNT